jgi:SEC-C motif-containing protein
MVGISDRARGAACPCGSGAPYSRCCRPFHTGQADAPTAEALMRSRYSAFVKRLPRYLVDTWSPADRPARLDLDHTVRWTGLQIVATAAGGVDDKSGTVEFIAGYQSPAGPGELHEVSRFGRDGAGWIYLGGTQPRPTRS